MSIGLSVIVIAIIGAIVAVAATVALVTWVASRGRPKPWQEPTVPDEHAVVTLQISTGEPDDPAVQRLVHDAAARQFAAFDHVKSVEVRRTDGMSLGTVKRDERMRPAADLPDSLRVEHAPRRHGPSVTGSSGTRRRPMDIDPSDFSSSDKLFADQFELPAAVRERITDPQSPTQVVAAILDQAGVAHRTEPGILVAEDTAIVLVGDGSGHTVTSDDLAKAFLRFESAHVREGVAVCLGYVNPQELHRRELLAPTLRHAGPEAIQRMADALQLGGNPVMFATGPAVG
jgi:hypothetical protein